ncbi:MAG: Flp pilus assembly complex ATPase component, partial [Chloroflexi bacterium]|nr:Flp pilus assembly complex ATPase component [Chloroflexota bacterium]
MVAEQTTSRTGQNGQADQNLARTCLWLAKKIEASLPNNITLERNPHILKLIKDRFALARKHASVSIAPADEAQFFEDLVDEIIGFGPLEKILSDEDVTEVMVNRADLIYIERKGKLTESGIAFVDDDHVERIIRKILEPLGRTVSRDMPLVDARLPDGSRVNAVIAPC